MLYLFVAIDHIQPPRTDEIRVKGKESSPVPSVPPVASYYYRTPVMTKIVGYIDFAVTSQHRNEIVVDMTRLPKNCSHWWRTTKPIYTKNDFLSHWMIRFDSCFLGANFWASIFLAFLWSWHFTTNSWKKIWAKIFGGNCFPKTTGDFRFKFRHSASTLIENAKQPNFNWFLHLSDSFSLSVPFDLSVCCLLWSKNRIVFTNNEIFIVFCVFISICVARKFCIELECN